MINVYAIYPACFPGRFDSTFLRIIANLAAITRSKNYYQLGVTPRQAADLNKLLDISSKDSIKDENLIGEAPTFLPHLQLQLELFRRLRRKGLEIAYFPILKDEPIPPTEPIARELYEIIGRLGGIEAQERFLNSYLLNPYNSPWVLHHPQREKLLPPQFYNIFEDGNNILASLIPYSLFLSPAYWDGLNKEGFNIRRAEFGVYNDITPTLVSYYPPEINQQLAPTIQEVGGKLIEKD